MPTFSAPTGASASITAANGVVITQDGHEASEVVSGHGSSHSITEEKKETTPQSPQHVSRSQSTTRNDPRCQFRDLKVVNGQTHEPDLIHGQPDYFKSLVASALDTRHLPTVKFIDPKHLGTASLYPLTPDQPQVTGQDLSGEHGTALALELATNLMESHTLAEIRSEMIKVATAGSTSDADLKRVGELLSQLDKIFKILASYELDYYRNNVMRHRLDAGNLFLRHSSDPGLRLIQLGDRHGGQPSSSNSENTDGHDTNADSHSENINGQSENTDGYSENTCTDSLSGELRSETRSEISRADQQPRRRLFSLNMLALFKERSRDIGSRLISSMSAYYGTRSTANRSSAMEEGRMADDERTEMPGWIKKAIDLVFNTIVLVVGAVPVSLYFGIRWLFADDSPDSPDPADPADPADSFTSSDSCDSDNRRTMTPPTSRTTRAAYEQNVRHVKYTMKKDFKQRLVAALLGGLSLVAPMLIMSLGPSLTKSLVTTSVFIFIFGIMAAWRTSMEPSQVLTATATYAAVLVVFTGVSN